jgi:hypothetical protein
LEVSDSVLLICKGRFEKFSMAESPTIELTISQKDNSKYFHISSVAHKTIIFAFIDLKISSVAESTFESWLSSLWHIWESEWKCKKDKV